MRMGKKVLDSKQSVSAGEFIIRQPGPWCVRRRGVSGSAAPGATSPGGSGQGWCGKGGAEAADGHEVNSHFAPWQ